MGSLFRKTATKALPAGAEIFTRKGERFARWFDAKGKTRTAPLTNASDRIVVTAATFTAKFRDGAGIVREVSTGCRDAGAARYVLTELERRSQLVKAGVMTSAESAVADHQATPLTDHLDGYRDYLAAKGTSKTYRDNTLRQLRRLFADCSFVRLGDVDRTGLERWLAAQTAAKMGARPRNSYRMDAVGFGNRRHPHRAGQANTPRDLPGPRGRGDQLTSSRQRDRCIPPRLGAAMWPAGRQNAQGHAGNN